MSAWLFIFGRTPELSFHELSSVIDTPVVRLVPDVAYVEGSLSPTDLIQRLGGTVKICRVRGNITAMSAETLLPFLDAGDKHLTFGMSGYGGVRMDTTLLRIIKERLEKQGVGARYVMPKEGDALTSVVVSKQRVSELVIVPGDGGFTVGETIAVQDFEAWNTRDYGRPFAEPKAGMLPPKVARMAVNLAGESRVKSKTSQKSKVLLDPFCGMGTILGEALLTGWSVIGSDQSEEVIGKAKKNIEFLQGTSLQDRKEVPYGLFVSDATHISEKIAPESIDAIVTEPFMGPTVVETENVKNVIKGLEKLYIGCLREWHKVLKPNGHIVIALPQYAVGDRVYFVKNVIDRCETFGYTVTLGPLEYSRPQAVVRRKFFVLWRT